MKAMPSERFRNIAFGSLFVVVIVFFAATLGILVHERVTFAQQLRTTAAALDTRAEETEDFADDTPEDASVQSLEDMARLLEAYNKSNTTDILALFYSTLTTLVFSYGLIIYSRMQNKADDAQKSLEAFFTGEGDIRSEIYFSSFADRLSLIQILVTEVSQFNAEVRSNRLSLIMQNLQDCRDKDFLLAEIVCMNVISQRYRRGICEALDGIKERLSQQAPDETPAANASPSEQNDAIAIAKSTDICDAYMGVILTLKDSAPAAPARRRGKTE